MLAIAVVGSLPWVVMGLGSILAPVVAFMVSVVTISLALSSPLAPLLRCMLNSFECMLGPSPQLRAGPLRCTNREFVCGMIFISVIDAMICCAYSTSVMF